MQKSNGHELHAPIKIAIGKALQGLLTTEVLVVDKSKGHADSEPFSKSLFNAQDPFHVRSIRA